MDSAPKGTGRGTATWPEEQLSAPAEVPTANSKGLRDPPGPGAGAAANSPAPGGCTGWVEAGRAHNETKPHLNSAVCEMSRENSWDVEPLVRIPECRGCPNSQFRGTEGSAD